MITPNFRLSGIPPEIWLEIFRYATYTPRSTTIAPLDPFIPDRLSNNVMGANTPLLSMRTKCDLVLVCQSWRKVATELLYEHIIIRSPRRATMILAVLRENARAASENGDGTNAHTNARPTCTLHNSEYGQWARHIEVYTHARRTESLLFLQDVFQILQHCRNLRMFSGSWMWLVPTGFLEGLSALYGPSLHGLAWDEQNISTTASETFTTRSFLASFHSLRILDLRNFVGSDSTDVQHNDEKPLLPNVRILLVSTRLRSLLIGLALYLPALRRLVFEIPSNPSTTNIPHQVFEPFVRTHGPFLTYLEIISPNPSEATLTTTLDISTFLHPMHCHNLHTLVFSQTLPIMQTLSTPHMSLRRIGLRDVNIDELYPSKTTQTKNHLLSFTREAFPGLEVVRTVGFLVDADIDGLAKDIFIWWAEMFDREAIDFQDGEGILWLYTDPAEVGNKDGPCKEGECLEMKRDLRTGEVGADDEGGVSASHYISTRVSARRAGNKLL